MITNPRALSGLRGSGDGDFIRDEKGIAFGQSVSIKRPIALKKMANAKGAIRRPIAKVMPPSTIFLIMYAPS
jgi:hypothetical protein